MKLRAPFPWFGGKSRVADIYDVRVLEEWARSKARQSTSDKAAR